MTDLAYRRLAPLADIPPNTMRAFQVGERSVLVCHTRDGVFAVDNVCTHGEARLDEGRLRGVRVICPLHGASFDCRSGAVLGAPAIRPLASFVSRIVDGWVEVQLPA
jgi:3-phenylpropionate/trans-cinnamate dioxygenase ferredoxin subunit